MAFSYYKRKNMNVSPKMICGLAMILFNISMLAQHLDYRLSYEGGDNRIGVVLRFLPLNDKKIEFLYANPMFGGQNDIVECITDITATGVNAWNFDKETRKLTVTPTERKDTITIRYDIYGKPNDKDYLQAELFRPIISDNTLYCHGLNLFLTPKTHDMTQSMYWEIKPPFQTIAIWNPDATENDTISNPTTKSYMSLLVGCDNLSLDHTNFQKMRGFVITALDETKSFNRKMISDFFKESMSSLRNFWNMSEAEDNYVFAMLPFSNHVTHEVGGIGLEGGFCSKYCDHAEKDTILTPSIKFNVTHEMGHKWLGGAFSLGMEHQWFHEGFNDYLTYSILSSSGLLSESQIENRWNKLLDTYYGSEIHTMSNDKILENYWTMGDYNKMPYWRGCIFAHYLNSLIKEGTNNNSDWRSFMNTLLSVVKRKGNLNIEDFISTLQPLLPPPYNAADLVEKHILKGEDIERRLVSWNQ